MFECFLALGPLTDVMFICTRSTAALGPMTSRRSLIEPDHTSDKKYYH